MNNFPSNLAFGFLCAYKHCFKGFPIGQSGLKMNDNDGPQMVHKILYFSCQFPISSFIVTFKPSLLRQTLLPLLSPLPHSQQTILPLTSERKQCGGLGPASAINVYLLRVFLWEGRLF